MFASHCARIPKHVTMLKRLLLCWYVVSLSAVTADSNSSHPFVDFFKPYYEFVDKVFVNLIHSINTSAACSRDTQSLITLSQHGDVRALKFLDATGKIESGILEGGVHFLGSYSECLRTSIYNESTGLDVSGKHCLVEIGFSNSLENNTDIPKDLWAVLKQNRKPSIGLCIPSSCAVSDLTPAVDQSLGGTNLLQADSANVIGCSEIAHISRDPAAISILFLFAAFALLTLCATGYDALRPRFKNDVTVSCEVICEKEGTDTMTYSFLENCLLSFSLTTNIPVLLGVQKPSPSSGPAKRTIDALHGIRFLTMAAIIMMHTYSFALKDLYFRNFHILADVPKQFAAQVFANGSLTVDTFYVMSGLLVTYITLRMVERHQMKFNVAYYVLHRIVRLTPLLLMVTAFCATLLDYIGSGPKWESSIAMYHDWCKENWWLTNLYLQNFINTEHMCLGHTWFLATDFQFYIAIIPVLILLYRKAWCAYVLIGIYFVASVVTTFALTYINKFPAVPYINSDMPLEVVNAYYKQVYIKPYCRIGPYLIGVLVGFLFYQKKQIHLKTVHVVIGWAVSVILVLFIIFLMFGANSGHLPAVGFAATYGAFARSVWALGIAWLTIACGYNYGGYINSFLSWKALVPLSRLTYCAYLIHPVVVEVYNGNVEMAVEFSYGYMLYLCLGNILCTYFISFILTLLFEIPFGKLEAAVLNRKPH